MKQQQQQWSSVLNKRSIELLKIKNPAVIMHSPPPHCTLFLTVPLIYTIYTLFYLTCFVHFLFFICTMHYFSVCHSLHYWFCINIMFTWMTMFMLQTHYHVVFFDEKDVTRGWLTPGAMVPFTGYESSKEFRTVSLSHPIKLSLPDTRVSAIHIRLRIWTPRQWRFILEYVTAVLRL